MASANSIPPRIKNYFISPKVQRLSKEFLAIDKDTRSSNFSKPLQQFLLDPIQETPK